MRRRLSAQWLVAAYRATLAVQRCTLELTGTEVSTTWHNDGRRGAVTHRRAGRLVGSFGGWFLGRAFEALGEEALSPPVDQTGLAAFIYEEVESPHATLQFGGRFDHASYRPEQGLTARDFNEGSGSIGLLLKPKAANDNVVVALNVAHASRYPALEELYYHGAHPGNLAFEVGDENLDAEHALGFDVSLRGRGNRFEGEVTFFHNDIKNYIFRQPTGEVEEEFPVLENVAADSSLMGFEAHADIKITSVVIAEVTGDMVRGELKSSGDPLPRIPPARGVFGLRYQKNALQVGGSSGRRRPDARVRYGNADRRQHHVQGFCLVFVLEGRRAQHRDGQARQRGRHAVSQPPELPEGCPARDGEVLQGGLFHRILTLQRMGESCPSMAPASQPVVDHWLALPLQYWQWPSVTGRSARMRGLRSAHFCSDGCCRSSKRTRSVSTMTRPVLRHSFQPSLLPKS